MARYTLSSNMSDRINFDQDMVTQAHDFINAADSDSLRRLTAADAADAYIATYRDEIAGLVDDLDEAQARIQAVFEKVWREEVRPRAIIVDAETFLDEEQLCQVCGAVVWLPGIGDEFEANEGAGEWVPCPECGSRYYASGEGRFARESVPQP